MNGKSCTHKIVQNFKLYEHEYDSNDFTIVLFDDCFSSANFEDDQSVDDVGEFLAKLMRTRLTNEDVAFIFSIESETWEKLLMKFSRILSHLSYAIIDLSEGTLEPNTEEKEGILRLQIAKSGGAIVAYYKDENLHPIEKIPITLSEKNMSTILRTDSKERVGFPQLCCLLCMNMNRIRGMHDIGIFRFPRTLIYSHFEAMSKSINMDDRMGLCILMYAAIKDGCFDKYNVNLDLMDKITDKVVKCTLDLRSGLRSLRNGILVRLTRSKYIIQHKVITEILLDYIDQNNIIV
ncbi:hypothetical protein FSP39_024889 [Pinctada imbricata]|uniref:Uncharacterized protein n=1 Tax=Pinctada imbricata TaxID=66713 RepID=A0AA88YNJ8_PINIB|nr:hypothetical protein FSP39_024889 [Pinctada imbricata]